MVNNIMAKGLVGKVKNEKFAYFWLLIGGAIGSILMLFYSVNYWPLFLPPAILSVLIAVASMNRVKRFKIGLVVDLILTFGLLMIFVPSVGTPLAELAASLPGALIVLGCILGICDW
jgi:hypothetical protein